MPIKIFSAPGDHRSDFEVVEEQVNRWMAESQANVVSLHVDVKAAPDKSRTGDFIMTVVVQYEG